MLFSIFFFLFAVTPIDDLRYYKWKKTALILRATTRKENTILKEDLKWKPTQTGVFNKYLVLFNSKNM